MSAERGECGGVAEYGISRACVCASAGAFSYWLVLLCQRHCSQLVLWSGPLCLLSGSPNQAGTVDFWKTKQSKTELKDYAVCIHLVQSFRVVSSGLCISARRLWFLTPDHFNVFESVSSVSLCHLLRCFWDQCCYCDNPQSNARSCQVRSVPILSKFSSACNVDWCGIRWNFFHTILFPVMFSNNGFCFLELTS